MTSGSSTTSQRLTRIRPAVRPSMKARLMLAGPAGAGKTKTALTIARLLADGADPLVIDTETESALTYADSLSFEHLPWDPPYDPRDLADVVAEVAPKWPAVIIDSGSHFWSDDGGTLDISTGKFTGWKAARPAQRDLITSVLRAPTHMIVCVRSKMQHDQQLVDGEWSVKKLGMAPIQDSTFEYEMNVSADLDMTHRIAIGKTRCDRLDGREFPAGHAEDLARIYAEWLKGGAPTVTTEQAEDLKRRLNALDGKVRARFKALYGHPNALLSTDFDAASAFVTEWENDLLRQAVDKGWDDSMALADPPAA